MIKQEPKSPGPMACGRCWPDSGGGPSTRRIMFLSFNGTGFELWPIDDAGLVLEDRNGHDLTEAFPELGQLPSHIVGDSAILDGEIVCLDAGGHPNPTLLERRLARPGRIIQRRRQAHYIASDVLSIDGRSVIAESLVTRKNLLHSLLRPGPNVQSADCIDTQGEAFFRATCEHGLEGIVAKRKSSVYQPGVRSDQWLKIRRVRHGEFVIGGYTFDGDRREPVKPESTEGHRWTA